MRTYKNLFEYAITDECMDRAFQNAIKSKKDRADVKEVIKNKAAVKEKIRKDFIEGNLPIYMHVACLKYDGASKKQRTIVKPFFTTDAPEQWMQHIIVEAIRDVLTKGMYFHSCGSVPKKGVHSGKRYLAKYLKRSGNKARYCLKIDLRKFYKNVNTDILKHKFQRIVKDEKMLSLIFWVIDNNKAQFPNGEIVEGGLTIGGYPSQYFANFYLQDFDHYIKEILRVPFYMRYMDDMVFLSNNKQELHKLRLLVENYFKPQKISLKPNYQVFRLCYKTWAGKEKGRFIDFMGFKFFKSKTTIRKSIFFNACRAVSQIVKRISRGKRLNHNDASKIMSYKGWFDSTDTHYAYACVISNRIDMALCKKIISAESKRRNYEYNLQTNVK